MTTFTPLPSNSPKSPKWGTLFSIAVVLMLVGGGILLIYAANKPKSTASATQIDAQYSTDAANTLAAMQSPTTLATALPTDTPNGLSTATLFPQLTFTTPDTSTTPPVATLAPTSISVSSCNGATYISDVTIPDNTVIAPGAGFVKTWALENTGTCTWDTSYKLVFTGGSQMGGAATAVTSSVAPSQQTNISVSMTAPTTAGTYTGYWRMTDDTGTGFGGSVTVVIVVSTSLTSTPTGTLATSTSTPSATKTTTAPTAAPTTHAPPSATPTSTQPATNTPSPTLPDTPTFTETPTP
jgi:hypothetical protein